MLQTYDTTTKPSREQFDYWREELCRNFVALAPERSTDGGFCGQISQQRLSVVSISRVTADGHCVNRTRTEISRSPEDCFFANLQLKGTGVTRQGTVDVVAGPGDLVLVNASHPYAIAHDAPFDLLSVKVPHDLFRSRRDLGRTARVPHIAANRGYGKVLRSYAMSILYELESEFVQSAPFLAENLVSLISSALTAVDVNPDNRALSTAQYARLQDILGYIKLNLAEPQLNLESAAERFHLSSRYVQKLIAATGSTFSLIVLKWRLEKVAASLRSASPQVRTLSDLAYAWGFNDFAYFSRAFKAMFGVSPREYRKRRQACPGD